MPKATIVIPAYNAGLWIDRSLDSATGQTEADIEIIVVDDGSTDHTALRVAARAAADQRIKLIRTGNNGQGAARNTGIAAATGDCVMFLDADDLYLPEKVEKQVRYLDEHPACHVVYCRCLVVFDVQPNTLFELRAPLPSGDVLAPLLRANVINPNALCVRRTALTPSLRFKEGLAGRFAEDWEFCLRLSAAGYDFGLVQEALVVAYSREGSTSNWNTQCVMKRNTIAMLSEIMADIPPSRRCGLPEPERVFASHRRRLFFASLLQPASPSAALAASRPLLAADRVLRQLLPAGFLRTLIMKMWKFRRLRVVYRVVGPAGSLSYEHPS